MEQLIITLKLKGPDGYQSIQDWQTGISYSLGNLKPGSYEWTVFARNSAGQKSASNTFAVQPGKSDTSTPIAAPYEATFSGNVAGWTSTGLWQRTGFKTGAENQTGWIFGSNTDYSKADSRNSGDLTSPPIFIGYAGQQFSFRFATLTESGGGIWDQRQIQISVDGAPFQTVMTISGKSDGSLSESKPLDLGDYVGKNIRFRFHFDTIDPLYNKGLGWAITAVRISDDPSKVCTEFSEDGSPEKAREIALGDNAESQICPVGDVDYFTFSVDKGQPFSATVNLTTPDSSAQPGLDLLSSDGKTTL